MEMVELKDLTGKHILSGIEIGKVVREAWYGGTEEPNCVKFTLDGVTYMAVEDPSDGYRSYMEDLVVVEEPCKIRLPDVEVICHMKEDDRYERNDVLVFVDALNGKTILELGTANYDDYYPYCVMEYIPENMNCNATRV
jgi:hypothetical protein